MYRKINQTTELQVYGNHFVFYQHTLEKSYLR